MSLFFAVVHEAEADFQTATEIADRVLLEAIYWLDDSGLDYQRTWVSHTPNGERLTWKRIKQLARDAGIAVSGHIDNQPAYPDARAARRAILYLLTLFSELEGIIVVRDQDDQPERRDGLEQARREFSGSIAIVIGFAIVEREAWVISGFDPRILSHELTACKKRPNSAHSQTSPEELVS